MLCPLSSCKKFNRHSRLLTFALNREHVEGISAVVRVRRWDDVCLSVCLFCLVLFLPASTTTHCFFPEQSMQCCVVAGFFPLGIFFFFGFALACF